MYQFVETRASSTSADAVYLFHKHRQAARSIQHFPFNKKRLKVLSESKEISDKRSGIVYWMSRNQRIEDNWSLLYAQALGLKNSLPLHVVFCLAEKFLDATFRHYKFMIEGLKEVQTECVNLNINFHLLRGQAGEQVPNFIRKYNIGALVCDASPLRIHREWVDNVRKNLSADVPLIQVDG